MVDGEREGEIFNFKCFASRTGGAEYIFKSSNNSFGIKIDIIRAWKWREIKRSYKFIIKDSNSLRSNKSKYLISWI